MRPLQDPPIAEDNGQDHFNNTLRRSLAVRLAPAVFGLFAILSVIGEYQLLLYSWSGHESPLICGTFVLLPIMAIGFAISSIVLSIAGINRSGGGRVLGVAGLVMGLLTFMLCCVLFSFFFIAGGGAMGL
jgi:hypothetical protein